MSENCRMHSIFQMVFDVLTGHWASDGRVVVAKGSCEDRIMERCETCMGLWLRACASSSSKPHQFSPLSSVPPCSELWCGEMVTDGNEFMNISYWLIEEIQKTCWHFLLSSSTSRTFLGDRGWNRKISLGYSLQIYDGQVENGHKLFQMNYTHPLSSYLSILPCSPWPNHAAFIYQYI